MKIWSGGGGLVGNGFEIFLIFPQRDAFGIASFFIKEKRREPGL